MNWVIQQIFTVQRVRRAVLLAAACCAYSSAEAGHRNNTFAGKPEKRRNAQEKAAESYTQKRADAETWAKKHRVRVRRRSDGRTIELMEVRNGRPRYRTTRNSNAAISSAANLVRDFSPYNLDGSGVTIGLWDADSARTNHQEFAGGRIAVLDTYVLTDPHGTHVAGTLAAAGVNSNAKGMAPAASVDSYDWNNDFAEMTARGASYAGEPGMLYLSNHSYGDDAGWMFTGGMYSWQGSGWSATAQDAWFGQYDDWAHNLDEIVYNAPYFLPFKASGNDREDNPAPGSTVMYRRITYTYDPALHPAGDAYYKEGYDTIPTDGNAKNIITIGSVSDAVLAGVRSPGSAVPIPRGSWGPVDDGRIKPDIVANGEALYSTSSSGNSAYYTESGTSMASPNACGSAALLVQHYANLFPGSAMRASSLKGLILHTADDIGRPGPDYQYGWGLMNTLAAVQHLDELASGAPLRLLEASLSDDEPVRHYYFGCSSNVPLRATLCWTDPPAAASYADDDRVPDLIHDLDLRLIAPDGTVHYPFKLDYNNPTNLATTLAENNVDNVEQIYLSTPQAGTYTLVVDYDGLLTNGVQWYSLLIDGDDGSDTDGDGMPDAWELQYFGNPTNGAADADADGDGSMNLTEYVAGYSPNDSNESFRADAYFPPLTGGEPPIIIWNSISGRIYNVSWTSNLVDAAFTNVSGDLAYPENHFIDLAGNITSQKFYRVDVRLDQ